MDTNRQRVLDWINNLREKVGASPVDSLLPGEPVDMENCTITNTFRHNNPNVDWATTTPNSTNRDGIYRLVPFFGTSNRWGELEYSTNDDDVVVAIPKYVAEFANDFDQDKFPDLIG